MTTTADFETAQRATIRDERRRLSRTRRILQTALAHPSANGAENVALFDACIGYLDVATKRLIAQDIALVEELRPALPLDKKSDHDFLNELETRLNMRAQELADLVAAMATLRQDAAAGRQKFADAVAYYFTAPSTARSRPMHSLPPLIEAYGSPHTWDNAQAAAERCGSEVAAFAIVEQRMWPGLDALVAEVERRERDARPT